MGRKKADLSESPVGPEETELLEETEESGDFEAMVVDQDGCGRQHGGRRRLARGLEERESADLPDEPPPGYFG